MKRQPELLTIIVAALFLQLGLCIGCGSQNPRLERPYRAEILKFVPHESVSGGSWTVAEQELKTLEDLESLNGNQFQINLGGTLKINAALGSLLSTEDVSAANPPKLRFDEKSGVIIPRDTTTLYALSSFYAYESVLSQVKDATGVESTDFLNSIQGKLRVRFEPSFQIKDDSSTTTLTLKLNAAFDPFVNQFILFKRSEAEYVPFSTNVKIIAHEFGHFVFKHSFFQKQFSPCELPKSSEIEDRIKDKFFNGRMENEFIISGFNEGFADFFSFVVTGSELIPSDFGEILGNSRSLTGSPFTFQQLGNSSVCAESFYCVGTLFARALFQSAQEYRSNKKELMAFSQRVYNALSQTQARLKENLFSTLVPLPSPQIAACTTRDKLLPTYDSALSGAFLSAFLSSFSSGEEKNKLCSNLINLFSDAGFPQEARFVCGS